MEIQIPQFTTPEEPKKSWVSSHHLLGYLFLLAVFAAVVSGIYYLQVSERQEFPAPVVHEASISDWKTYTNTEYGFEFKYPDYKYVDGLTIEQNTKNLSLDQWLYESEDYYSEREVNEINKEPGSGIGYSENTFSVNNTKIFQNRIAGEGTGIDSVYTFIPKNNIIIVFKTALKWDGANDEVLNQILSTFKFTDTASASVTGTLKGHATIGPICPVEQIDNPCQPTAEMYTSYIVTVYKSDGVAIADQKNLDGTGNYSFDLASGNYFVTIAPNGLSKDIPHPVTVSTEQTTIYDFNVDTGIR